MGKEYLSNDLVHEKREAIKIARQLGYSKKYLEELEKCDNVKRIPIIMATARRSRTA